MTYTHTHSIASSTQSTDTPTTEQNDAQDFYQLREIIQYRHKQRRARRIQRRMEVAQSTDGIDPLYNADNLPAEYRKRLNQQDKQFKKQQRTKVLNIIHQHSEDNVVSK